MMAPWLTIWHCRRSSRAARELLCVALMKSCTLDELQLTCAPSALHCLQLLGEQQEQIANLRAASMYFTADQIANFPQGFQPWVHSDAAARLMVAWWNGGNTTGYRDADAAMGELPCPCDSHTRCSRFARLKGW